MNRPESHRLVGENLQPCYAVRRGGGGGRAHTHEKTDVIKGQQPVPSQLKGTGYVFSGVPYTLEESRYWGGYWRNISVSKAGKNTTRIRSIGMNRYLKENVYSPPGWR